MKYEIKMKEIKNIKKRNKKNKIPQDWRRVPDLLYDRADSGCLSTIKWSELIIRTVKFPM